VQVAFAALCVWIGVEFHFFVDYIQSGGETAVAARPPGVEGFLPISSLMSLYYLFLSGEIHPAHPAGMFILVAVIAVSITFGKSFCSWLCPVGFISENLGNLGQRLFRRRIKLPKLLDYPLRSLKYLLLGFFLFSIFALMDAASLKRFLDSPYNVVADIKMYLFFVNISVFALVVILALIILSVLIRGFWCRFLCPYGALLGLLSIVSLTKIRRNKITCIDCGKCSRACPSFINVDRVSAVVSDECTSCMSCVDACPVDDTLVLKSLVQARRIPKAMVAVGVVGLFLIITGAAMLFGKWQNNVTDREYVDHYGKMGSYGHPRGFSEVEEPREPVKPKSPEYEAHDRDK
jgi:polyferredoxin